MGDVKDRITKVKTGQNLTKKLGERLVQVFKQDLFKKLLLKFRFFGLLPDRDCPWGRLEWKLDGIQNHSDVGIRSSHHVHLVGPFFALKVFQVLFR